MILRDAFADLVGPRRAVAQLALIAAGAVLTYLLNQDAVKIAIASVVAFAASESVEAVVYVALRDRPWMTRAPVSACIGAAVDSVLFITLAFGFSFQLAFLQWVAKTAGGWFWAQLIDLAKTRRAVLLRHS